MLLGVALELAQKSGRMGRIDHQQASQQVRALRGQVPGQRAAPVVRHQQVQRGSLGFDGGHQIGHQVFGAVGLGVGGR